MTRLLFAALLATSSVGSSLEHTEARRPTASLAVTCTPGARSCTFSGAGSDSSATGAIISYTFDWGDGRIESRTTPVATNTWSPGMYCVRLTVTDRSGLTSYATKQVAVPYVAGTKFAACSATAAPPRVDTVTVQLPPIHDTTVVRLPCVCDTVSAVVVPPPPTTLGGARLATGPTSFVNTRYVPPAGRTLRVAQGQSLQLALDTARSGDVLLLQAGATFTGPFTLKPKQGTATITIRSDAADADLPPEGTRMAPSYAALLPKLVAPSAYNLVVSTAPRAANYRLMFLEVAPLAGTGTNTLIRLGSANADQPVLDSIPSNIVLDRVYLHGYPTTTLVRAVQLHGAGLAVVDSYLSEIHANGQDSQAIVGWNGPGPYKIVNNLLSAAGENVMFGGADPLIPGMIASDIVMQRNYVWKDPAWKGSVWSVKNHLEFKVGQRALIEGNIFENNWVAAQTGLSILIKSTNQSGGFTSAVSRDIIFRSNRIRNVVSGITIAARPDGPALAANLVTVTNNLFEQVSGGIGVRLNGDVRNVVFQRNTLLFSTSGGLTTVQFDRGAGPGSDSVAFVGNLLQKATYGVFGLDGAGGEGTNSLTTYHASFTGNVMNGVASPQYPAGNTYVATLAQLLATTSAGVDLVALTKATQGVVQP